MHENGSSHAHVRKSNLDSQANTQINEHFAKQIEDVESSLYRRQQPIRRIRGAMKSWTKPHK